MSLDMLDLKIPFSLKVHCADNSKQRKSCFEMCDQYFVCYVLNIQENGKYNFLSLLFHGRNVLFNLFQC